VELPILFFREQSTLITISQCRSPADSSGPFRHSEIRREPRGQSGRIELIEGRYLLTNLLAASWAIDRASASNSTKQASWIFKILAKKIMETGLTCVDIQDIMDMRRKNQCLEQRFKSPFD
jgi:hypothetical protein